MITLKIYIKRNGANCLYCESHELTTGPCGQDDFGIAQEVSCGDCGKKWTDIYTLTDVEVE